MDNLRKINSFLTILVVGLGAYIVLSPFIPALTNWWQREHAPQSTLVQSVQNNSNPPNVNDSASKPEGNRLAIPAMNLDTEILEGQSVKTVNKGVWRRPNTSAPGQGSNTVLVAHRYSYNPGIDHSFYSLNVVKAGDNLGVYWNDKLYTYTVQEVKIVPDTAVEVEAPTSKETLTLYTCTPLWTNENRLVVIATPAESESNET